MFLYRYISEYNIVLNELDYIEIALWFISIGVMAVLGIKYFQLAKRLNKNAVYIGLFFYFFIAGRICRLIAKFVIGYEYGFFEFTGMLLVLAILYTISTYIGLFFVYFFIEHGIVKKTHYIFSALVLVATILSIVNYAFPATMIILAPLYVVVLLGLPFIFINLAIKSSGSIRKNALIVAIGIILFAFGIAFDVPEAASIWMNIPGMPEVIKFASPVLQIVGSLMIYRGFPKEV
ncbi:MAG: hypothetical protein ACOC44_15190 [Promethearchaeia archaeon]